MLRRLAILLLAAALLLTGCSTPPKEHRITVVAAIFPEYDWVRQIIGNVSGVDLILLVDDGVDPHSFQPTVGDLITVGGCDLLIYSGGESDEWLENLPVENTNPNRISLALLPLLGEKAYTAENVEGMQIREEGEEADEHVWLSLRNAAFFCEQIAQALGKIDPQNAVHYQENLKQYLQRLDALDKAYQEMVGCAQKGTILVCDRFPFRYLVEDYGLGYYAAFPGCSSESGASFQTMVFLADKTKELSLNAVLTLEGSDQRIARTVAASAAHPVEILTLNSMQAISSADAAYMDYLTIMEYNLAALTAALN